MSDVSATNIRSLISHPAVEVTNNIDHAPARISPTAPRGPYISDRPVWVARLLEFLVHALLFAGAVALAAGAVRADPFLGSVLVGAVAAHRSIHVALGLVTIVLVYLLTREWYGATAHVPHFFFVALAFFAFGRFLTRQRPAYLYAAAASLGLASYVKEHSALLVIGGERHSVEKPATAGYQRVSDRTDEHEPESAWAESLPVAPLAESDGIERVVDGCMGQVSVED
jgi:hypothetical protein